MCMKSHNGVYGTLNYAVICKKVAIGNGSINGVKIAHHVGYIAAVISKVSLWKVNEVPRALVCIQIRK